MYPYNNGANNYSQSAYPQMSNYSYPYPNNTQRNNTLNTYIPQPTNPTIQDNTQAPLDNNLVGRMVDKTDEIMPSEIRMDGSFGFFPMKDLSAIYVKQWDQNANLLTVRYVPDTTVQQQENDQAVLSNILDQLNDIQNLLKQNNYKPRSNKSNYHKKSKNNHDKNKKAVNDNV